MVIVMNKEDDYDLVWKRWPPNIFFFAKELQSQLNLFIVRVRQM